MTESSPRATKIRPRRRSGDGWTTTAGALKRPWPEWARPGRAWFRRVAAVIVLATVPVMGAPGTARALLPEGAITELAQQSWMPALLGEDHGAWFRALAEMRRYPELARDSLLLALSLSKSHSRRWRLIHHMGEFGAVGDIPALLTLLDGDPSERERTMVMGASRALYPVFASEADRTQDLASAVIEFIFIQTGTPQPYDTRREGTVTLDDHVFRAYYRTKLPVAVISRLKSLRGKRFSSRDALAEAMEGRLRGRTWRKWEATLLQQVEPTPRRSMIEGILRAEVQNRAQRPLLVAVGFDVWFGRFERPPGQRLLYVPPGEIARLDQPVRIVGSVEGPPVRVDLGMREVHHMPATLYRKLYIPIEP